MFKKLMFAAAAAVTMTFTTLAGNATWQLASGQAFRGDGQACLYQTYTNNGSADWYTVDLGDVVSAFANGTLDLSNPPRSTGYSGANGVKGPADVVDGVFAPQATTLGNMYDWWFSLVALVKVNGQDMLYVSGLNEKGGEGKYTTLLEFSLGTAEYDATGGYKGPGYYRRPVPTAKAVVENDGKTLRFVYDTADYGTKGTGWFSVAEAEAIGSISEDVPWRDCAENVTNAIFDASFAAYKPAQFINWFFGFNRLAAIEGIDNLDTSAAADFSYMFGFCLSLEALDVTCFDTASATNMSCMFASCPSLTSLDVSGFNTANVVNMDGLFYECSSLTDLDVTHFDTSRVTDMDGMFANCCALASLDVTGFDTANVTNMYEMFYACSSLMSLDVTGFDTSKVTDMYDMFGWCESLASLDVTGFDTAQVTDMGGMFYSCGALTSLDLTGFDTAKVKNMSYMFYDATNLATIVACDSFATSALNSDEKMFRGCVKLVGGNGTAFDDGMIDATAARIDRAGAPGYFTAPPPGTFFTLSFDANGGDDYAHSQMILSTNALRTLPSAVPTKSANKFLGWATTADGEAAYQAGDRYATGAAGASATLYAKWVNVGDYTIRFDGNSAKATGVPEDIVTPYGSKPTIPADPARDYWTFDGWTNAVNDHVYHAGDLFDEGCEGSSVFVLYAKWTAASASDLEYVDAAGSTWTYDRKGDEVTITDFTPGAEATDATPPATIDDCTVTNPDFDPGLVYSAGAWLTYSISSSKASITGFVGTLPANLVIPETVTAGGQSYPVAEIGYCAFDATVKPHRTTLKSVVIPGSVKDIDSKAFCYCEALETVTLGEGVERICTEAFIYAGVKLAEIEFPDSLTYIGGNAFWNVRRECDYAADGGRYADTKHTYLIAIDQSLEGEVVVADTVKITGDGACMKLKATSVVFPSGLEVFGRNSTFQENSHTVAVTLPGSARLGEGTATGYTTYIKTVTVMGAPPSWNLTSIFTAVEKIVYNIAYANEWADYIETYHLDAAMFEATTYAEPVGDYVKYDLEQDLGVVIGPYDSKEKVSAKGLPPGLKLVATKQTKKDKKKTVTNVVYTVEGVPTAACDFTQQPVYAVVTSGGKTTWQPIILSVAPQAVTDLDPLALGESVTTNACEWLPGVTNGWSVSGLPTGLKYTAKAVYSGSGKNKKLKYPAYTVYGKTTKAGLFTITAKKKVGSFYETLKYRVMVEPKAVDAEIFPGLVDVVATAYESYSNAVPAAVDKVSGLPAGLKFAAKDVYAYANAKKKTGKYVKQAAQTIVGTPTKAGTYIVTYTKNVTIGKNKVAKTAQIVWTVLPSPVVPEVGFNVSGGVVLNRNAGSSYATDSAAAMTFNVTPGAVVTASGLPKGLSLKQVAGGVWAIAGTPTKAGTSYVTVTAKLNGNAVTQSVAIQVNAHPLAGSYVGEIWAADDSYLGTAKLTVSSVGKVSLSLVEKGVKTSATLSKVTAVEEDPMKPQAGKWKCVFSLKADKKKILPKRTLTLVFKRKLGEWELPYCDTESYKTAADATFGDLELHRTLSKAEIAARVDAGRIPPLPTVETLAILAGVSGDSYGEPVATGEVVVVSAVYKASAAAYTVTGRLPDGKTFSASSPVLWWGNADDSHDGLKMNTIAVSNGSGKQYLLGVYLPYGATSPESELQWCWYRQCWDDGQEWYADTFYGIFGDDWVALPGTVSAALGTIPEEGLRFEFFWRAATLPGEYVHEERRFKVVSKKVKEKKKTVTRYYASVSADGGETWVTSANPISWSAGRASFSVVLGGFTLTFDLALDKNGNFVGWARKSHAETDKKGKKKTVVDAVGAATVSDTPS